MADYSYEKYRHLGTSNEDQSSKKKRKKKKNKQLGLVASKPGMLKQFNQLPTKNNANNSAIKAAVDALAALVVGPAISASLGKFAPLAGAGLAFGGHYMGDESGMMRGIGMSTMGHSLAKVHEYREPDSTVGKRLGGIKDDILRMFLFQTPSTASNTGSPEVGSVTVTPIEPESSRPLEGSEPPEFSGLDEEDHDAIDRAFEESMAKANAYYDSRPTNGVDETEEEEDDLADESLNGDDFTDPDFVDFSKM